MKINSFEKKLSRAEDSVRICKLNIENQEIKLKEIIIKIAKIHSIIASINSIPSNELEKLISIDDKLMINVEVHKGIILELQEDLNFNRNNLHELKSQQKCSFF